MPLIFRCRTLALVPEDATEITLKSGEILVALGDVAYFEENLERARRGKGQLAVSLVKEDGRAHSVRPDDVAGLAPADATT